MYCAILSSKWKGKNKASQRPTRAFRQWVVTAATSIIFHCKHAGEEERLPLFSPAQIFATAPSSVWPWQLQEAQQKKKDGGDNFAGIWIPYIVKDKVVKNIPTKVELMKREL